MSADRSDDIARLAAANRFRLQRTDLAARVRGLLGPHVVYELLADSTRAAAIAEEFWDSLRFAESNERSFFVREWSTDDIESVSAVLHRINHSLGRRLVWVSWSQRESQVAELDSDAVLDNPIGFANLSDHELRLLDREVTAGLWLGRHAHHFGPDHAEYSWELNVWGEPWLAAATRAIREAE